MSYKNFSKRVTNILENNYPNTLSLLIEEDDLGSLFGDDPLEDEDKKNNKKKDSSDDTAEDTDTDGPADPDTDGPADPEGGVSKEQISGDLTNVADSLKNMMSFYDRFGQGGSDGESIGLHAIQDYLSTQISESIERDRKLLESQNSYSLSKKNSISYFLNEEVSVEDVEKDIDTVNNIIDKGSELIDKFKKGTDLNINRYVDAAINAFKNFDSLFSKESIVKQAVINLIVLNSGAKAEKNIKEFEELFHEELHSQFGIEYEEHALITKPVDVAVGAVKQG